jgi:hypothetical protein
MADYIDKNILCQAYIHIEIPQKLSKTEKEHIRKGLLEYAQARAKFFVYPDVEVEVEFKDGSLKAYLSIAGAIYLAIGEYGDFRSGIDFLHADIKRLSDTLVSESLFLTKARPNQIVRTEARTGVIGQLKTLINDIDALEVSIGQISVDEAARRIKRISDDAEILLENLQNEKDKEEAEDEIDRFASSLPVKCPYPKEKVPDDAAIFLYQDALSEFRKKLAKRRQVRTPKPKKP